jgi:sugar phosphate isomerase/epimerase
VDEVGIEYQTVLGYPPVEFVGLAADLGCRTISMKAWTGLHSPYNPYGYEKFSLLDDVRLRRRMLGELDERGVTISLAEGFVVMPGTDLLDDLPSLDVMRELGARRANAVTMDPDLHRSFDQLAAFTEVAADRGMQTTLEFSKSLAIGDLGTALDAIRYVGRPDFKLLIDTMHVVRTGSTAADLAAVDSSLFGYVQLCDNTLEQRNEVYRDDSSDRSAPGDGELPLVELLSALPEGLPIGVEAPMRTRAAEGVSARECARRAVEGARNVLAEVRLKKAS